MPKKTAAKVLARVKRLQGRLEGDVLHVGRVPISKYAELMAFSVEQVTKDRKLAKIVANPEYVECNFDFNKATAMSREQLKKVFDSRTGAIAKRALELADGNKTRAISYLDRIAKQYEKIFAKGTELMNEHGYFQRKEEQHTGYTHNTKHYLTLLTTKLGEDFHKAAELLKA